MSVPAPHWLARRTGIDASTAPAVRHSARQVLDEGSRPSAAEPALEVTFSRYGLSAGRHLLEVHDHYRAELAQLRELLEQVRAGATHIGAARSELNAMTLRANDWTLGSYCQAQCVALTQHHSMETGAIFPHLQARQPDLGAVIDRLNTEHGVIHELLDAVDAALVQLVQHPGDHDSITAAVDLLTDTLLSHFAYEERELIAPLARYGFYGGQV